MLSTLVPSLSWFNVWDLPVWLWRTYAAMHDDHVRQLKEEARRG